LSAWLPWQAGVAALGAYILVLVVLLVYLVRVPMEAR
jgi:hypothetical protein